MSISDADYQKWLADDFQQRVILVEAEHSAGTEYIATAPYISGPSDTPANIAYEDLIAEIPEVHGTIDGESTIGDLAFYNDGTLDGWLGRAWRGWPLRFYLGAPAWARDDFRLIGSGINAGISAPGRGRLAFDIKDKRELLGVPVQSTLAANGDPVVLSLGGALFNLEPVLDNAATLRYRYHENGNAVATAVRDNGVVVGFTDQGDGSFILLATPAGRVTCDVSGETSGTPAALVQWLALRAPGISLADIDTAALAAFPATYTLGLYIRGSRTVQQALEEVAAAAGAVVMFDRLGLLHLVRLDVPAAPVLDLYADDIAERNGLTVERLEEPRARIQLGYARNWAPQDPASLAGAVTPANRELYSRAEQLVTATNTGLSAYPLAPSPDPVSTLIISQAEAQTEADRRALMRSEKRVTYVARGFAAPFQVVIGQTVRLFHHRYSFDSGELMLVIGIRQRPTQNRVELELWA